MPDGYSILNQDQVSSNQYMNAMDGSQPSAPIQTDMSMIQKNVQAITQAGGTSKDVARYLDSKGIKYNVTPPSTKVTSNIPSSQPTMGNALTGRVPLDKYQAGERNLLGNIFDRPAAALRGAALNPSNPGQGYTKGAINPSAVPTLQDLALNSYYKNVPDFPGKTLVGNIPSAVGLAGDVVTNPANLLGMLAGKAPVGSGMNLGELAAKSAPVKALGKLGQTNLTDLPELAQNAVTNIKNAITPVEKQVANLETKLSDVVRTGISKGIKPTLGTKATLGKTDALYKSATDGVKAIILNKDNLGLTDEAGASVSRVPQSVADYAKAIESTKSRIYKEYIDLAQQAGEQGVKFNASDIVGKLQKISTDLGHSPEIREYAAKMIDQIRELYGASPDVVQSRIQDLNKSLGGYYAGRVAKGQAEVDASVASAMREELDSMISKATGSQYAPLKKLYGSLKAIENGVNRRAAVIANQTGTPVSDLTDIFSGTRILHGALTGNIPQVAEGVGAKAISLLVKKMNSPDRYISNMFKDAESIMNKTSALKSSIPEAVTPEVLNPNSSNIAQKAITGAEKVSPKGLPAPETKYGEGFTATDKPTYNPKGQVGQSFLKERWTDNAGKASLKNVAATAGATVAGIGVAKEVKAMQPAPNKQTIGMKNNNPGNLKGFKMGWQGSSGQDKFGHVQFNTLEDGIRANMKNLQNHQKKNPDETLIHYLHTAYAQKNGANEARFIAKKLGIPATTKLKDLGWNKAAPHLWKIESKMDITEQQIKQALGGK